MLGIGYAKFQSSDILVNILNQFNAIHNGLVQVQQFKPYIRSHRRPPVMTVQTKKNISVWKPYIHYHKDC